MPQNSPDYTQQFLEKMVKPTLSIGGGIIGGLVGTPLDAISGPGGNIGGALLGSALGNAGGQQIENIYNNMNGHPSSPANLPSAALQGATQEMTGQTAGSLAGKLFDALKLPVPPISEQPPAVDGISYHGSNSSVPNPIASKSSTGLAGKSFYVSSERPVAEGFANLRSAINGGEPEVTSYYNKANIPEYTVNKDTINDVADKLGLSKNDRYSLANNVNSEQAYTNLIRMSAIKQGISAQEAGQQLANILQKEGYGKITMPIFDTRGTMQTAHFDPTESLIHKPLYDTMNQNYKDTLANNENIDMTNRMIGNGSQNVNMLLQALSRKDNKN